MTGPAGPAAEEHPRTAGDATAPGRPATRAARLLTLAIVAYRRWISPALPARCRFYPSCSAYALEAVGRHGALRGTLLAVWRLLRCHPFHPGGYDPVPTTPGWWPGWTRAQRAARSARRRRADVTGAPNC
ncbi:MAG TPA: membrane protein insertion efficiency factor YidD [Pilimelia sp.]|nr:membrane protein insertion efficiency factor YidD [Pilimelia sp.]